MKGEPGIKGDTGPKGHPGYQGPPGEVVSNLACMFMCIACEVIYLVSTHSCDELRQKNKVEA